MAASIALQPTWRWQRSAASAADVAWAFGSAYRGDSGCSKTPTITMKPCPRALTLSVDRAERTQLPFVRARETRGAYPRRMSGEPTSVARPAAATVCRLIETLGGRYSAQLGIAVDQGPDEVERWFLAATLFGHRISAEVAMRTYRAIERAGIRTIAAAAGATWDELVALLDEGGYVRYDFSTASRLLALAGTVIERHQGRISTLAETTDDPAEIEATLDRLPGWGPTTVRLFLRELRGVWPGARPPCDKRARWARLARGARRAGRRRPAGSRVDPRPARAGTWPAACAVPRRRSLPRLARRVARTCSANQMLARHYAPIGWVEEWG
jgi:hypothetical protein